MWSAAALCRFSTPQPSAVVSAPRFSDAREYPLISDAGFRWNSARDDKALEGQRTPYHVACGRPLPLSTPQPSAVVSAPGFPMHGSIP